MLKVERLETAYGDSQVLFGVDLEVGEGEVVALLGRNGAGKSTTLKTLMGLVPPRAGTITFGGQRVDGRAPYAICRLGLGYVPEDRRVFAELSVEENLAVGRRPKRDDAPHWTPAPTGHRCCATTPSPGG